MIVLGLNAFHGDSAAAILRDGKLVAAAEEERFRRIKHWAGFPSRAIAYCLAEAGLSIADVDHIAVNQNSRANLLAKLQYAVWQRPSLGLLLERSRNRQARAGIPELVTKNFGGQSVRAELHHVEHHLAHMSSAFHVSPFNEAAVVSVDGFGDFSSAAWGTGRGTTIDVGSRVYFPHSLGVFYQAVTQYLGFPHYGDEYKVMGLAPYGSPSMLSAMRKIVELQPDGTFKLNLSFFRHHREAIAYNWSDGAPEVAELFTPALEDLLGPRRDPLAPLESRHHDIARSAQAMYEEAFFHILERAHSIAHDKNLTLAGGCAMNSVANGKVIRQSAFQNVYVQSAAGDAGGAIGAAFVVWHKLGGARRFNMEHAYWGPQFSDAAIDDLIGEHGKRLSDANCVIETLAEEELCRRTAAQIADGQVIGWFQGRMEWGPRALGNRSILADPRRANMKDILNAKIKRRESFRPFAPSVLDGAVGEWFEEDAPVPFMMQVFQIRPDKRPLIPAVTHVDGSGRLQTVSASSNPRYHKLIAAFCEITNVPMVLNTSFNENEPVVCEPREALDCFLRTRMDVLVLNNTMISRRPNP